MESEDELVKTVRPGAVLRRLGRGVLDLLYPPAVQQRID
jgi:hypothetical protein